MAAPLDPKVAKCLLLTKVLAADGIMTENEKAFLERAMVKLGIGAEDKRRITNLEGWDQAEDALRHLGEEEKRAIVSELVDAASADGRLSPLEAAMVKRIGAALGLD